MKKMKFFAAIFAVLMAMVACEPIDPTQGQGGNNTTTTEYGKGTEAEPYTVAGVVKTATGEAWVKGYIVGFMQTGDSNYPVFSAETDTKAERSIDTASTILNILVIFFIYLSSF